MQWAFIISIILLAAGSVAVVILSLRESYRNTLRDIENSVEEFRSLTAEHIAIYERMYALVFFFGNDLSADKTEFSVSEDASLQELFSINMQVDFELSLLSEKISKSESLMKERGASVRKINGEIEKHESAFMTCTAFLNKQILSAKRYSSFRFSKYILKNLGKCVYKPVIFEKR